MKKYLIILTIGFFSSAVFAQGNDPVVMNVNGKDVKKSEFEYLYKKNNTGIALDEYVELFKNFKLKVAEAETQGIDTTAAFIKELKDNRDQLAKQYIKELAVNESMLLDEYNRLKEDVEISHIALPIKEEKYTDEEGKERTQPSFQLIPADTLAPYKKMIQIRNRIMKGEKFENVAEEVGKTYNMQNNPPTYLGWISAMSMYPSIEDAMYDTKPGNISMPVRVNGVYLLIKVHNKRPSPGEINASHIMVACPQNADTVQVQDAMKKADEIYQRLIAGEDFATLAKELSDDKGSGQQGGELGWFGTGSMVKEFETAAFALKNKGDISKPIRSQFGFHIIQLNDVRGIAPFEQKKSQIVNVLSRSNKVSEFRKPGVDDLKKKNNFISDGKALAELMAIANQYHPADSIFGAKAGAVNGVLFSSWNTPYRVASFVEFMNQTRAPYVLSTDIVADRYDAYILNVLQKDEDNHLEDEYSEFKNLMQEYRDGFLSYEVTQNEVWEKAPKDTVGLTSFFDTNKDKYNWDKPRHKGYVVLCKDSKVKKNAEKAVKKMKPEEAVKLLVKEFNSDSIKLVKIEKGLFQEGANAYVDELVFKNGKTAEVNKNYPEVFIIGKMLQNGPECYSDVGGLVISDYQNYLEQEWIKKLREKYTIQVYPEVLKTID